MTAYRSPSGEVIAVPGEGGSSLEALGWTPVEGTEPEPKKRPVRKKTQ